MMNSFDDLYLNDITIYSSNKYQFDETIDYLSNEYEIPDTLLIKCYKSCNHYDMSLMIPSTASIRLQNIAWRRLNKNLNKSPEVNPQEINWYKDYDINWCYGPKYPNGDLISYDTPEHEQQIQQHEEELSFNCSFDNPPGPQGFDCDFDYDSDYESESLQSTSTDSLISCNSLDSNFSSSSFETSIKSSPNSNLKAAATNASPNDCQPGQACKRVKFNFIVSTREIINGMSIDYDFLDDSMFQIQ